MTVRIQDRRPIEDSSFLELVQARPATLLVPGAPLGDPKLFGKLVVRVLLRKYGWHADMAFDLLADLVNLANKGKSVLEVVQRFTHSDAESAEIADEIASIDAYVNIMLQQS